MHDPGSLAVLLADLPSLRGHQRRRIYRLLLWGSPRPNVLVAAYDWDDYMDVINIRGVDRVAAARLPIYDGLDVFAPSRAVWHYLGTLEPAVTTMLQLPPPDHRDAPAPTYPTPLTLFVASHEQRPMAIKPGIHRVKQANATGMTTRVMGGSAVEEG